MVQHVALNSKNEKQHLWTMFLRPLSKLADTFTSYRKPNCHIPAECLLCGGWREYSFAQEEVEFIPDSLGPWRCVFGGGHTFLLIDFRRCRIAEGKSRRKIIAVASCSVVAFAFFDSTWRFLSTIFLQKQDLPQPCFLKNLSNFFQQVLLLL